jgi:hypothetical protein
MFNSIVPRTLTAATLAAVLVMQPAHARSTIAPEPASRPVDLVIALDVSGSMSGLIDSAKQRLWDVVNELQQAQPKPDLRVAVLSYGNPRYGKRNGFVRIDVPLTADLDSVNQALFAFTTSGGSEYVARVIARATDRLQWSTDPQALRVMFVAGNEAANQDPKLSVREVLRRASARDIVVNTIFCGNDGNGGIPAGWREVAQLGGGSYASIDQNAAAVAAIAAPQDDRLRALNDRLNDTYLPYGDQGDRRQANQLEQDRNAETMSRPAAASRAVTKASAAYRSDSWDLVDAVEQGTRIESIATEALPAPMRSMSTEERARHVAEHARRRNTIRAEIERLGKERKDFIQQEQEAQAGPAGLDGALTRGLRDAAQKKGFRFLQ